MVALSAEGCMEWRLAGGAGPLQPRPGSIPGEIQNKIDSRIQVLASQPQQVMSEVDAQQQRTWGRGGFVRNPSLPSWEKRKEHRSLWE